MTIIASFINQIALRLALFEKKQRFRFACVFVQFRFQTNIEFLSIFLYFVFLEFNIIKVRLCVLIEIIGSM